MNTNNKNFYIVLAVVAILIVLGVVCWKTQTFMLLTGLNQQPANNNFQAQDNVSPPDDSTTAINQSLDATDTGDVDSQFQQVDRDLKNL